MGLIKLTFLIKIKILSLTKSAFICACKPTLNKHPHLNRLVIKATEGNLVCGSFRIINPASVSHTYWDTDTIYVHIYVYANYLKSHKVVSPRLLSEIWYCSCYIKMAIFIDVVTTTIYSNDHISRKCAILVCSIHYVYDSYFFLKHAQHSNETLKTQLHTLGIRVIYTLKGQFTQKKNHSFFYSHFFFLGI